MKEFIKKDPVLSVSLFVAVISAFFVRPDKEYFDYIDFRVLALLFGLMVLVKGFQDAGLFEFMVGVLTERVGNARSLVRALVLCCFFSSMLITNDVALITFVPFAIYTLEYSGLQKYTIITVVLQTVAANLGSMATPVGNPQNLYLFSVSGMDLLTFLKSVLPYMAISFVLILAVTLFIPKTAIIAETAKSKETNEINKKYVAVYATFFALMLLTVLRILPLVPVLALVVFALLVMRKGRLILSVDFGLLVTFVFLFVFVGNIGRIEAIRAAIVASLSGREILFSVLASQVFSNVPAAMLLSGFSDKYRELIIGTNIGGLGTLIASMASVISFKIYTKQSGSNAGRYMLMFSIVNFVGLILLLGMAWILEGGL